LLSCFEYSNVRRFCQVKVPPAVSGANYSLFFKHSQQDFKWGINLAVLGEKFRRREQTLALAIFSIPRIYLLGGYATSPTV